MITKKLWQEKSENITYVTVVINLMKISLKFLERGFNCQIDSTQSGDMF